jgi:hypothetical protein
MSRRCLHENCLTRPTFNYPTETKGIYCSQHKLENMICVTVKRCLHENCLVQPTFNYSTETKGIYCSQHKLENMISVHIKKCQHSKCKQTAVYGFPNKRPQYCQEHVADKKMTKLTYQ